MGHGDTATRAGVTQVARQLFTDEIHQALVSFCETRVQYLPLQSDNGDFSRRYGNNIGPFAHLHGQLVEFASEQFGEEVKPSYSFLSLYDDRGICPLHIDRDQCRYTIDYLIRQDSEDAWPIYIGQPITDERRESLRQSGLSHPATEDDIKRTKAKENFETIELQPNDAVLYSGTHQWHYRDRIKAGTADLVFFHFVPKDFDGPLD